ncbi:Chaperone protein dnaJ [Neodidymelliopsis sp. IMI 364377]|nr:Chaperone protein dnaJ [Neodidymelliopsis sp. IMI 364377]
MSDRAHHDGSAGRAYTVEQKAAVIRIKRCSPTAYYEILGLEDVKKTCTDSEIKKAYRKLSLLTHPDKNGYAGADEAFKLVSKAFQVLSDPDKKSKFDQFGGDPDARFNPAAAGAGGSSPFSGFAGQRGGGFQEEMTPEELFRQFFGGGFGAPFGGFDTGPGFVFNLGGGPGVRVHQFGGGRPRRRPGTAQPPGQEPQPSFGGALGNLLPLLFLFVLPLLSSLFSGSGSSSGPSFAFTPQREFTCQHTSSGATGVKYYVAPSVCTEYGSSPRDKRWKALDKQVEQSYVHTLDVRCTQEQHSQSKKMQDAQGWFFIDEEAMAQARNMPMPNCELLQKYGLGRRRY